MHETKDHTTTIFKDRPASAGTYLYCFVVFLVFTIAVICLIGMVSEFYILDSDFMIGVAVLAVLALLSGWKLVRMIRAIIHIERGVPLISLHEDGIAILGDRLKRWAEIAKIRLVTDFDVKYIEVTCHNEADSMNYELYGAGETCEFKNLALLKQLMDKYIDNVEVAVV